VIILGNCLDKIKELETESVDAIVTDPPYELGFMGKAWDASGIAYNVDLWKECLRVLKPGGHLLAFSGTRTYHRMAVAIEDTGFEVRDMLEYIYASGFPKSLNVGKAVDKLQGNEREHLGTQEREGRSSGILGKKVQITRELTKGNSEWEGFGTALKPAHEPIIMARKPLSEKTIVENVLKHGTGAIDIDGCRIPTSDTYSYPNGAGGNSFSVGKEPDGKRIEPVESNTQGRFPANIIVTQDSLNDGVMTKSSKAGFHPRKGGNVYGGNALLSSKTIHQGGTEFGDSGSKSRYFDVDVWGEKHGLLQFPKASKRERNEGCEALDEGEVKHYTKNRRCKLCGHQQVSGSPCKCENPEWEIIERPVMKGGNNHPTVKPVHLMSWLVRLVSKEGDTVLDPFMGSGTTGVACKRLKREFIGIELSEEYIKIARARISAVEIPLFGA